MPTKTDTAKDSAKEVATTMREQLLASVRQSQKMALDATTTWMGYAQKAVPAMPAVPTLPGTPTKADVEEAINASFGLVEELVAAQRSFATSLIGTLMPTTRTAA